MPLVAQQRKQKAARNQSLFREVNERIQELALGGNIEFICECADDECTDTIVMSSDEYEAVRCQSNRFVVKPGHEVYDVEQVVEGHWRYLVVAKLGEGGELAELLDPRDPTPRPAT